MGMMVGWWAWPQGMTSSYVTLSHAVYLSTPLPPVCDMLPMPMLMFMLGAHALGANGA